MARKSTRKRQEAKATVKVQPRRIAVVKSKVQPAVEEITTVTDVVTQPRVEVRRPATLAQALQERAEIVVKPEKKAVTRTVRRRRVA